MIVRSIFGMAALWIGLNCGTVLAQDCRPKPHAVKHKAIRHDRPASHPYFWPYGHFLGFRYLTTQ